MPVKQEINARTVKNTNFSAAYVGKLGELNNYKLEIPALSRTVDGKVFLKELLTLTGMQISMNKLPAGRGLPYLHQHKQNEETYIFLKGRGQMQIDGEVFDVEEGTAVRIAPNGLRGLRNNSNEELQFICIQAKNESLSQETFEDGIPSTSPVIWPD